MLRKKTFGCNNVSCPHWECIVPARRRDVFYEAHLRCLTERSGDEWISSRSSYTGGRGGDQCWWFQPDCNLYGDSHAHQLRETDTVQGTDMQDHTQGKTDNDTRGKRRAAMMPSWQVLHYPLDTLGPWSQCVLLGSPMWQCVSKVSKQATLVPLYNVEPLVICLQTLEVVMLNWVCYPHKTMAVPYSISQHVFALVSHFLLDPSTQPFNLYLISSENKHNAKLYIWLAFLPVFKIEYS